VIGQGYRPKVGEELVVVVPSYHRREPGVSTAKVVKVVTEWVYFDNVPGLTEPKFRIRTQCTENRLNYNARYLTKEQHETERRRSEAEKTLREYKAVPDPWSALFKDDEKLIKLADAVRKIMEEENG
jgi:RecG-like helicase